MGVFHFTTVIVIHDGAAAVWARAEVSHEKAIIIPDDRDANIGAIEGRGVPRLIDENAIRNGDSIARSRRGAGGTDFGANGPGAIFVGLNPISIQRMCWAVIAVALSARSEGQNQ